MSTQTYALVFYGFPIDDTEANELEERVSEAGLGRKVRDVMYGPFDNYSYALAIRQSYTEVNADSIKPLRRVPQPDAHTVSDWEDVLLEAAKALGVTFKEPRWYVAPWRC